MLIGLKSIFNLKEDFGSVFWNSEKWHISSMHYKRNNRYGDLTQESILCAQGASRNQQPLLKEIF
jgi:hypothetical protein